MKWLVLLGILAFASIALTLAIVRPPSTPVPATEVQLATNIEMNQSVQEQANITPAVPTTTVTPTENATLLACRALEQRLLDELADADRVFRKSKRTLELENERYDNARFADNPDPAMVEQFRTDVEQAQDAVDAADAANKTATRKLAKARDECGLPG